MEFARDGFLAREYASRQATFYVERQERTNRMNDGGETYCFWGGFVGFELR
jgi:hypothetical protein